MIWVDGDEFIGWCCSTCEWGITMPRLESTVAALAFNRVAQETFEKHDCAANPAAIRIQRP
jgi:hypothetical protein